MLRGHGHTVRLMADVVVTQDADFDYALGLEVVKI